MNVLMLIVDTLQQNSVDEDVACVVVANKRNEMLNNCDWTQIADNGLTEEQREEWRLYRQELRDLTARPDFPFLESEPLPPKSKQWVAERTRTSEEEALILAEIEELNAQGRKMQADWEASRATCKLYFEIAN